MSAKEEFTVDIDRVRFALILRTEEIVKIRDGVWMLEIKIGPNLSHDINSVVQDLQEGGLKVEIL